MATIGETLIEIRRRSGLTLDEIAIAADYRGRSSVQKFFKETYDPPLLDVNVAARLVRAFEGYGNPPIRREELFALTGRDVRENEVVSFDNLTSVRKNVPVYPGYSALKDAIFPSQGPIRLYLIDLNTPLKHGWQPPAYMNNDGVMFGVQMLKGALMPRFRPGETMYIDSVSQPRLGDDAMFIIDLGQDERDLIDEGFDGALAAFGTVERFTEEDYCIRSIDGHDVHVIPHEQIREAHRILTTTDILG